MRSKVIAGKFKLGLEPMQRNISNKKNTAKHGARVAKDFLTASELNQLASSWGSHRFHSCYYRKSYLKL